jgi:hypothetical protein
MTPPNRGLFIYHPDQNWHVVFLLEATLCAESRRRATPPARINAPQCARTSGALADRGGAEIADAQ